MKKADLVFARIFCLLFAPLVCFSQNDSLLLVPDRLTVDDLRKNTTNVFNQKVVSASRSLQDIADLPFTIYVITKEEIEEKGYNTLVDALKWIPGIRTSQPGSGLEGETFLMRGLQGNTYAKIMVNGVPLKPFGVRGMPIGAQLPVRQAERIEVIYGPAAALYGTDASKGVINIITRESDRPLFTQADISVGANGFFSVHVLFGGKLGKGKNLFEYSIYGSSTAFNTRDIFRDTAWLYNAATYDPAGHYFESNNFRRSAPGSSVPIFNQTPHESRLGGARFKFRNWNVNVQRMYRRDHSSLGLNTSAVSYANPNNYVAEFIDNVHINWQKNWEKWGVGLHGQFLSYKFDENSSYRYVHNTLNRALNLAAFQTSSTPAELEMKEQAIQDRFFSGSRFAYNESRDLRLEMVYNFNFWKFLEIVVGGDIHGATAEIENYLNRPHDFASILEDELTVDLWPTNQFRVGIFGQAYLSFDRFKGIFSFNYDNSDFYTNNFNPRLALLYKLGKRLSLRGFYGESIKTPAPYYFGNFYAIDVNRLDQLLVGFDPDAGIEHPNLLPEENTTVEFGLRWIGDRFLKIDAALFYTDTRQFISFAPFVMEELLGNQYVINGYFNFGNAQIRLLGLQGQVTLRNLTKPSKLEAVLSFSFSRGEETLPGLGEGQTIDVVRESPKFIGQLQLGFAITDKIKLFADQIYLTNSFSRSLQTITEFELNQNRFNLNDYYVLDLTARAQLTSNLTGYMKVINVLDTAFGGLSATGTPDDLIYNPQSGRLWQIGMAYRLD